MANIYYWVPFLLLKPCFITINPTIPDAKEPAIMPTFAELK